jgi:LCP family protein required for cell wall assembly
MPDHAVPGRRRRWVLWTALGVVAVLGLGAGATTVFLRHRMVANIERLGDPFAALPERPAVVPPEGGDGAGTGPAGTTDGAAAGTTDGAAVGEETGVGTALRLLVVGSDSRTSAGDPARWSRGGQRSDTLMLVHLPADRRSAAVMSFPRDAWVDVPGHGPAKINAAYSLGGPALLVRTVEQLTQVRVDHVLATDFTSFTSISDQLGGVELTLRTDLESDGTVVPAGRHLLTGAQALDYVRERKGLARGDLDRVQRQQAWLRAIVARVRNEGTLRNPAESVPFLDALTRSVAADDGLDAAAVDDLLDRVRDLGSTDIRFLTVPVAGTGTSPDGQSVVNLDRPALDALMAAVARDDLTAHLDAHAGALDLLPPVAP